MRRLLAPLTRWLDRRIDTRIAGVSNRSLQDTINRLRSSRVDRSTFAGIAAGAVGLIPDGHADPVKTARSPHDQDAGRYGLSLEWVALDGTGATGGMLDVLPPVGTSFFQVVATDSGTVLLSGGTPLPDNHVRYGSVTRVCPDGARAIAIALLRAADLTSDGPSNDRAHGEAQPHEASPRLNRANAARGAR